MEPGKGLGNPPVRFEQACEEGIKHRTRLTTGAAAVIHPLTFPFSTVN